MLCSYTHARARQGAGGHQTQFVGCDVGIRGARVGDAARTQTHIRTCRDAAHRHRGTCHVTNIGCCTGHRAIEHGDAGASLYVNRARTSGRNSCILDNAGASDHTDVAGAARGRVNRIVQRDGTCRGLKQYVTRARGDHVAADNQVAHLIDQHYCTITSAAQFTLRGIRGVRRSRIRADAVHIHRGGVDRHAIGLSDKHATACNISREACHRGFEVVATRADTCLGV